MLAMMSKTGYHILTSVGKVHHAPPVHYYYQIEVADCDVDVNQTVLPAVYFDIIFPWNLSIIINDKKLDLTKPFVSPILQNGQKVIFKKGARIFGIRINPLFANHLFNISPKEFEQGPNDFYKIIQKKYLASIEHIVFKNHEFIDKVPALNSFLLSAIHHGFEKNAFDDCLWKIKSSPSITVKELSKEMKWSTRWLEMKFQDHLGASPTDIIKIVRLNRFLHALEKNPNLKLTRLAVEAGYYDQSHLIRDFKRFSSSAPGYYKKSYPLISKVMNHL